MTQVNIAVYGSSHVKKLADFVKNRPTTKFTCIGASGVSLLDFQTRPEWTRLKKSQPDGVIVLLGGNDITTEDITPEEIHKRALNCAKEIPMLPTVKLINFMSIMHRMVKNIKRFNPDDMSKNGFNGKKTHANRLMAADSDINLVQTYGGYELNDGIHLHPSDDNGIPLQCKHFNLLAVEMINAINHRPVYISELHNRVGRQISKELRWNDTLVGLDGLVPVVKMAQHMKTTSRVILQVSTNEPEAMKRIEVVGNRIRAHQGHGVPIDPVAFGYELVELEDQTFCHYTIKRHANDIRRQGLKRMKRTFIHMLKLTCFTDDEMMAEGYTAAVDVTAKSLSDMGVEVYINKRSTYLTSGPIPNGMLDVRPL